MDLAELRTEYDLATAWTRALFADLGDDEVMWRPHERSSAIAWHLGHQAAVAHYLVRNLVEAEPSPAPELDAVFDSATPEPARGALPGLARIEEYREAVARRIHRLVDQFAAGEFRAADQLTHITSSLLESVINHEYQHSTWIAEVRATLGHGPGPAPASTRLVTVDGYPVLHARS